MSKQQTALEWYDNEIGKLLDQFLMGNIEFYEFQNQRFKLEQQAKEMEKEQKHRDFTDGYMHGSEREPLNHDVIDKWYNETYGGNK
jgi:predicted  nucleic acid-binding Zn-ribbon protein